MVTSQLGRSFSSANTQPDLLDANASQGIVLSLSKDVSDAPVDSLLKLAQHGATSLLMLNTSVQVCLLSKVQMTTDIRIQQGTRYSALFYYGSQIKDPPICSGGCKACGFSFIS